MRNADEPASNEDGRRHTLVNMSDNRGRKSVIPLLDHGFLPPAHFLLALLVVAIWGTNFVVIHEGLAEFPPLTFASLRFFLASVPILLFVRWPAASVVTVAGYGFLIGVGQFGLMLYAMDGHISPGLASVLIQSQAFFTVALALLVAGEKLSRQNLAGLALCAAGVMFIVLNTGRRYHSGRRYAGARGSGCLGRGKHRGATRRPDQRSQPCCVEQCFCCHSVDRCRFCLGRAGSDRQCTCRCKRRSLGDCVLAGLCQRLVRLCGLELAAWPPSRFQNSTAWPDGSRLRAWGIGMVSRRGHARMEAYCCGRDSVWACGKPLRPEEPDFRASQEQQSLKSRAIDCMAFNQVAEALLKIAMLAFDGFTDVDLFLPWDFFWRVKVPYGAGYTGNWEPVICADAPTITSYSGVQISVTGTLADVRDADGVFIVSGDGSRAKMADDGFMNALKLDAGRQHIAAIDSGVLILAALGLLEGRSATTYATVFPELEAMGVTTQRTALVAHGAIATAGGCLSGLDLAAWLVEALIGKEAADAVAASFARVS